MNTGVKQYNVMLTTGKKVKTAATSADAAKLMVMNAERCPDTAIVQVKEVVMKEISFKRVNNDVNGNPRFVCHYLTLITDKDREELKQDFAASLERNPFLIHELEYNAALRRAKKLGGKQYRGKDYGGGIVFQSYNIWETKRDICEAIM